jgi:Fe2+ or Zn2+ uptake regulation protein
MKLSEQIKEYCTLNNLRCTDKRLMLADFLQNAGQADADGLYMRFRSNAIRISPATIYQILDWMVQKGFVERVEGGPRNLYCIRQAHLSQAQNEK